MRTWLPLLFATLMLGLIASPASAQCENCCPGVPCQNMCGEICLDGMKCADGQPIECWDGGPYCPLSPIVIDAQNQGFHLTSMKGGVKFTFGANLVQTSWTDPDYSNAWLALDRNGNGVIDDAGELFGDLTPQPPSPNPNGYKALAVFDDPRNGGNPDALPAGGGRRRLPRR